MLFFLFLFPIDESYCYYWLDAIILLIYWLVCFLLFKWLGSILSVLFL